MGWRGRVAHPKSPDGGAGPGFFRSAFPVGGVEGVAEADPREPSRASDAEPLQQQAPRPPNPPPQTQARSLGSLKSVQSAVADVEIEGKVLADDTGGPADGAHTGFDVPRTSSPGYSHAGGKVTQINGKFTWKGTLSIQTRYGTGASASSLSCYGRGTTTQDMQSRDITLGFHESCHRSDLVSYLSANPLPDPPAISVGMATKDYDAAVKKFGADLQAYRDAMERDSKNKTDEVGRRLSEVASKGCIVHQVP
ncbi:MAG TPA: hypothetical protein VMG12_27385 [Polyangiaceae bacterium]|nr:hypothetical protein [Polyangiaceae bacterium]